MTDEERELYAAAEETYLSNLYDVDLSNGERIAFLIALRLGQLV